MTKESKNSAPLSTEELKEKYKHRGSLIWEKYPDLAEAWAQQEEEYRASEEYKRHNMEYDMSCSDLIKSKVQKDVYAQNLYAALCNTEWQKKEVFALLKAEHWHCTWRSAGGIVAELRGVGDYLDWYCAGLQHDDCGLPDGFVSEGTVTNEIQADLLSIGWHLVVNNSDNAV